MASTKTSDLITTLDPPSLGPGHPVFANILTVPLSDTITQINISGQVALLPDGTVPTGLAAQMDLCLSRLSTCLEAAGATVHDLTRFMYYFTEEAWKTEHALEMVVEKAEKWLEGHRPASCCLIVKGLSEGRFLCEFEGTAVVRR